MRHAASRLPRLTVSSLALLLAVLLAACGSGISSSSSGTKPAAPALPPAAQAPAPEPQPAPAPEPVPAPANSESAAQPVPAKPYATAAILLPISGRAAMTGAALFNAAQLALFEIADKNFTLLPYDTKGTPEGATAAIQQALGASPDIVIGPLFAAEVSAAAPYVRQANVPMIALSADRTVAGQGVYVLGFLPGPQALRVALFAARHGKRRLAILAPADEYGKRVAEEVANTAPELGVAVTGVEYYGETGTDIAGPAKRLEKVDAANPGDVGFDALLLPDGGARLRSAAAALPLSGIDPERVKFLGTMLWGDTDVSGEPALAGGWFPTPPVAAHIAFEDRYAKNFGSKPPRIASLAYDATALAAVLARKTPRDFSAAALTNPAGFAGVDGLFRLLTDGTIDRGYAIDEVQKGEPPREIEPAPTNFSGAGM